MARPSFSDRAAGFRKGLVIGGHVNNQDFWGITFGRPTAFVLLVVVGDWRWVTPNVLTHISNALFAAGSLLILGDTQAAWIAAAVLLNLSLTFDCADGQLARYRGSGSELGAYYDKVSDALSLVLLFGVLGWVVTQQQGELYYFAFALLSVSGQLTTGYAKWVAMAALHRRNAAPPPPPAPPPMSAARTIGTVLLKVFRFAEPDLLFWTALALVFDKLHWLLWLTVCTQVPIAIGGVIARAVQVARVDRA